MSQGGVVHIRHAGFRVQGVPWFDHLHFTYSTPHFALRIRVKLITYLTTQFGLCLYL
jgi:hypothetical protein